MANENRGFASSLNNDFQEQQRGYQQDFRGFGDYNQQGGSYWQESEAQPAQSRLSPFANEFQPGRIYHRLTGENTRGGRGARQRRQRRQRGKGGKSHHKEHNYRSPASPGHPLRRAFNHSDLTEYNLEAGVNSIQISDARNRLRDCLVEPVNHQVRYQDKGKQPERAHHLNPEEWPTIRESTYETKPSKPAREQSTIFQDPELMAANGAPRTPTGPSASQTSPGTRTKRLPNHVQIADAYIFQQTIDERLKAIGVTPAREDNLRLAGVQWIDQVRRALKL
jgi:hypothetical protein